MKTFISIVRNQREGVILSLALLLFTCSSYVNAQSTNGLSLYRLIMPDTSYLGTTDTNVYVTIKNLGSTTYQGYANFYYTTDTVAFSPLPLTNAPTVTMMPGDTFQIHCSITFDSTYFDTANNIVVVWSSGNAIAPADSLWDKVYLKTMSPVVAIDVKNNYGVLNIYPNIASDYIFLEYFTAMEPTKIFIEDISGRIILTVSPIYDEKNRIGVNISSLMPGIYFLDAILPDKQRFVSKFVKTD